MDKESGGNGLRSRGDLKKEGRLPVAAEADLEKEKRSKGDGEESSIADEWGSIAILLLLYTLQGLPMGISSSVTMLLKEKGVSYSEIGTFSLSSWPFSLKILWAPLVDTVYFARVGRRKTWMIPAQMLIGVVLLCMSASVDTLLEGGHPQVETLTALFLSLYLLCATQDIAVDGWALTMLRPENVGWAATCNAVGQTLGTALGFTGYMVLEQWKLVTLSSFLSMWGMIFLIVTVLVAIFKEEKPIPEEEEPDGVATTYRIMMDCFRLPSIKILVVILCTWKAAFPLADSIAPLKLQESGVPKEHLAYISSLLMPLSMVLPIFAAKWTSGKAPLELAMWVYPVRLLLGAALAGLVFYTPTVLASNSQLFYLVLFVLSAALVGAMQLMFVAQMAFFARISDPAYGGTYMTMLNTLNNLGGMWTAPLSFYLVDALTCRDELCLVKRDGFHAVAVLSFVVGAVWYAIGRPVVGRMQNWPLENWRVK